MVRLKGYDYWKTTDVLGEMQAALEHKLNITKEKLLEESLQHPNLAPLDLQYCIDVFGPHSDETDVALTAIAKKSMVNHNDDFYCYRYCYPATLQTRNDF